MQQIINITQARNDLSRTISAVAKKKQPVVIVRDSIPEAVIISYSEFIASESEKQKLWQLRFDRLLKQGKKAFNIWAKKQKKSLNNLDDDKVYDIVKKA